MMVGLFLISFACIYLIYRHIKHAAFILVLVNLVLILLMLIHHATDKINIRL
jgi:hypothetical protein